MKISSRYLSQTRRYEFLLENPQFRENMEFRTNTFNEHKKNGI